ncbi:hypothetical protein BpHYR1_048884 [Brachionus plicatilis]|uniref:Uncharacterized protein n=1 Tax=Brachionus plicatilis TaxID=10195 RepID=A0A3M7QJ82_BRAPC|nr:hypothetical protein BpHYR1_048884 [Brachionus plicatilis]
MLTTCLSPSFNLTHIVPFFQVIYYLSLHLSRIHHHFPENHYNYHQRLQTIFLEGPKNPSSGLTTKKG